MIHRTYTDWISDMLWPYAIMIASIAALLHISRGSNLQFGFASMLTGSLAVLYVPASGFAAVLTDGLAKHWLYASAAGVIACVLFAIASTTRSHKQRTTV